MSNRFVISDTHFTHTNSWAKFKLKDGSPMRPFNSNEEMDETMIDNWNRVVTDHDTVYHLGDVVINKKGLALVNRLKGRKILIRGNHDIFDDQLYRDAGFEQIHGVRVFVDRWIMSHIPLHPDSVTDRFRVNVHGHYHANEVMLDDAIDPRYISACVEMNDYTPVSFDELEIKIQKRFDVCGYQPTRGHFNGPGPS